VVCMRLLVCSIRKRTSCYMMGRIQQLSGFQNHLDDVLVAMCLCGHTRNQVQDKDIHFKIYLLTRGVFVLINGFLSVKNNTFHMDPEQTRLGELEERGGAITPEYVDIVNSMSLKILDQLRESSAAERTAAGGASRRRGRKRSTRKTKLGK